MTEQSLKRAFAACPSTPESWICEADAPAPRAANAVKLTVDVTPELRGRIKITAFQRGVTVADMLRALLAHEFPAPSGDTP